LKRRILLSSGFALAILYLKPRFNLSMLKALYIKKLVSYGKKETSKI